MTPDDFIKLAVIFSLVVFPALGITARFALKPIVDAILRLKEGGLINSPDTALAAQVRRLNEEIAQLQDTVGRLQDAETFNRRLAGPGEGPLSLPPE